jgi:hypothetical protein
MKPRHAAAFALVGWYLMLLPKNDPSNTYFAVPWASVQKSFDTARECEVARAKAVVPSDEPAPRETETPNERSDPGLAAPRTAKPTPTPSRAFYCVASDDPRLQAAGGKSE